MKKFLLSLAACVSLFSANAQEYATTPETAQPLPAGGLFITDLSQYPAEMWFTYTQTTFPVGYCGQAPWIASGEQQIAVYLCNGGQSAFQMIDGSDTYMLFSGKEYLVKITPKATGFFNLDAGPTNPNWTAGDYKYLPIDITESMNLTQSVEPGKTKWFLVKSNYASQLTITNFMDPTVGSKISKVEAIHIECPGGTNVGTGLIGPYIKAGETVVGVTASETATEPVEFNFGFNAYGEVNCGNNGGFGKTPVSKMTVGVKSGYPDAYYTVDRYFEVPADGNYTFINHGAKGTILNVGKVIVNANNRNECDWTDIKSATVGNEDAVITLENLKAGDKLVVESDAFGVIGEGADNLPYLLVTSDQSGIADITTDASAMTAAVAGNKLTVSGAILAQGAEVAVYDMQARKVAAAVSAAGDESIDLDLNVTPGVYVVVAYGKGNSESVKISVK